MQPENKKMLFGQGQISCIEFNNLCSKLTKQKNVLTSRISLHVTQKLEFKIRTLTIIKNWAIEFHLKVISKKHNFLIPKKNQTLHKA